MTDGDFSNRDALAGVLPSLVTRWSPRAFQPFEIDHETLARLMDAARWSPSGFNEQPWRFFTSDADTFNQYLALLDEKNRAWAQHASVIGFLVGKTHFRRNNNPNSSFALDCGAAWFAMTLQAQHEGLHTHGMAGIDRAGIAEYLHLDPNAEQVLMGFAIGKRGDTAQLPEGLQALEQPSGRLPLEDIWTAGAPRG